MNTPYIPIQHFVMTPSKANLLNHNVIQDVKCEPLLQRENVDRDALKTCAIKVVFNFKVPQKFDFDERGIRVFDYSKRRRVEQVRRKSCLFLFAELF